MSAVTEKVSAYIRDKKINLSKMARDTGLNYALLYGSLGEQGRKRSLRDDEFLVVCDYLKVDPRDFADR